MIPIIERVGEWRFAGTATNFGQALQRLGEFIAELPIREWSGPPLTALAEFGTVEGIAYSDDEVREGWSYPPEHEDLSDHEIVVFGEGQATADDFGLCVLEVPSFRRVRRPLAGARVRSEWRVPCRRCAAAGR